MEPNWGPYNSYYSGDRPPPAYPYPVCTEESPPLCRSMNQGTCLPPPPPVTLPPTSGSYPCWGYHGSSSGALGMGSSGGRGPAGGNPLTSMHMAPGMPYSHRIGGVSQPMGACHCPLQLSPAKMSALPAGCSEHPHGYFPRIPMNSLSPLSSSAHVACPPHLSASTLASSYTPSVPPPHSKVDLLDHHMKKMPTSSGSGHSSPNELNDEQPWGMPHQQYKALNPRDKKQVRNRIGARRFRAKRKGYISQLEATRKESDARILQLEAQLQASRRDINQLRARLDMVPLPSVDSPLGLVRNNE